MDVNNHLGRYSIKFSNSILVRDLLNEILNSFYLSVKLNISNQQMSVFSCIHLVSALLFKIFSLNDKVLNIFFKVFHVSLKILKTKFCDL